MLCGQPYEKIVDVESNHDPAKLFSVRPPSSPAQSTEPFKTRQEGCPHIAKLLLLAFLIWALLLIYGAHYSLVGATEHCRPCSFKECERSMCNPDFSAYMCVTGAAHDGCAVNPSYWQMSSDCDACCDSTHCIETEPTNEDDTMTTCDPCSAEQCNTFLSECNQNQWYICIEGSATNGCSDDMYHWASSLSVICSRCCNGEAC